MPGIDASELAYYDAGIWVSYMAGPNDRHYKTCMPLIRDLDLGKRTVVVTDLVTTETIDVLRKIPSRDTKYSDPDDDAGRTIANDMIGRFTNYVERMSARGSIIITRPHVSMADHYDAVLKKCRQHSGRLRRITACPKCPSRIYGVPPDGRCGSCKREIVPVTKYVYTVLGPIDMEHAYLAKYSGADALYTVDESFGDLAGDPDFDSIRFEVV